MSKIYSVIVILLFIGLPKSLVSQNMSNVTAEDYFTYGDYNRSLIEYLKEYKNNKEDTEICTNIGYCYLKTNGDKSKSIPFLEYVYSQEKYDDEILLYLGMAYMYNYEFDKAIQFFKDFKNVAPSSDQLFVSHQIVNCGYAKALIKKPIDVTFVNLGKKVNSKYPDYYPFITRKQDKLYFTSSRITNARKIKSSEGYFTADIYFSKDRIGSWGKPKSVGPVINTEEDEQCVSITADGRNMIIYVDNLNVHGDLFISSIVGRSRYFPKAKQLNEPINLKSIEQNGFVTADGNTLLFSSDRAGGFGGLDLYKSKRLPDGEWGTPINIGPNINSAYDESFPVLDETNKILYFSSEGHTNMGGFDVFKAKYNPSTLEFGQPSNIGYPINTPEDNIGFSITEDGRHGYIGAVRKEGYGDLDIYKIVFNKTESKLTVIKGIINTDDSLNIRINAIATLFDANTNELLDELVIDSFSGKFIFAVTTGKYKIAIESDGFFDSEEIITVLDKSSYKFKIEKYILLNKKPTPQVAPNVATPLDSLSAPVKN